MLHLCAFPSSLNVALLKNGPVPSSESSTLVSAVVHYQDTGSCSFIMLLDYRRREREDISGGRAIILPQTGSAIKLSIHMNAIRNKDRQKLPM